MYNRGRGSAWLLFVHRIPWNCRRRESDPRLYSRAAGNWEVAGHPTDAFVVEALTGVLGRRLSGGEMHFADAAVSNCLQDCIAFRSVGFLGVQRVKTLFTDGQLNYPKSFFMR
jgi:hypothetical protein